MEEIANYVHLISTHDNLMLHLYRSRLEEAGYDIRIFNEQVSTLYQIPHMEARIFVTDDHYAEAKVLVERVKASITNPDLQQDFSEVDHADIEYEKQVNAVEQKLQNANPKNFILFIIVVIIVFLICFLSLLNS